MRRKHLFIAAVLGIALGSFLAACAARPSLGVSEKKTETTTRYGIDAGEYSVGHPVTGQAPTCPPSIGSPDAAPTPATVTVITDSDGVNWRLVGMIAAGLLLLAGLVGLLLRGKGPKGGMKVLSVLLACCALTLTACDKEKAGEQAQAVGGLVTQVGTASGLSIIATVGAAISGLGALLAGKKASIGQKYAEGGWSKDEIDELAAAFKGQGYVLTKAP